ncbi:S8 family serine peptidase [Halorarius litoreus]|uniref:S8 family serine peptidase n=1 Tax=Halorarius litoreus TaxID=2962676 RepID=UPI0020CC8A9A|nr:S8 family serine peptidase [Halorarius litoreus]
MEFDRRTFVQGAGAATAAAAIPGTAAATPPTAKVDRSLDTDDGPQEVIVVFESNDAVDALDRFDLVKGYHKFAVLPMGYTVATGDQIERIAALQSVRRVEANAELDYYNEDARAVTGAEAIQSNLDETGDAAHVVVIDSGISALHPDHQQNLKHNYKYTNPLDRETMWVDVGNNADTDDNGHGTHVSGSIAGDGTQSGGAQRGMAPEASLTVYSTGVTLAVVNSIGAFDHMLDNHTPETAASPDEIAHIVSNSYGPTSGNDADFNPNSAINVAAYEAFEAGILPAFAAGNSGPGTNTLSNYSKAPYILGVAATTDEKVVTDFSSRGRPTSYDGETNYDRQQAMQNFLDLRAAQDATPKDTTSTGQTPTASGTAGGAAVVGLNQTGPQFTIESFSGDFTPDRYELTATLTWEPSTEEAGAQANTAELALLDGQGNEVDSTGNNGAATPEENAVTLTTTVDEGAVYQYQVTGWRGAVQWEVSGEVFAIDAADSTADPSGPYGIYRPGVGAPGNLVLSTMSPNDPLQETDTGVENSAMPYYAAISGTSMATPVTSGIAALIYSAYSKQYGEGPDPMTVIEALESTAAFIEVKDHTTYNIGKGFVDAEAALETALGGGQQTASAPTADAFSARDTNPNDQSATIEADYTVSDAGADLDTVTVDLEGTDGASQTRTVDVAGESASGTVSFDRITRAGGETYELTLTVIDGSGRTATATDSVAVDQRGNGGRRTAAYRMD